MLLSALPAPLGSLKLHGSVLSSSFRKFTPSMFQRVAEAAPDPEAATPASRAKELKRMPSRPLLRPRVL